MERWEREGTERVVLLPLASWTGHPKQRALEQREAVCSSERAVGLLPWSEDDAAKQGPG